MKKLAGGLAAALLLSTAAIAGGGSPATGRWVLDVSSSTFAKAAPKSAEVVINDEGTSLRWHAKSVNAEGVANEASGVDVYGKASPLEGGKGERLITRVNASTVKRSFKYPDGGSLEDTCTVTAETMTCAGTRTLDGKSVATKAVYTRAK